MGPRGAARMRGAGKGVQYDSTFRFPAPCIPHPAPSPMRIAGIDYGTVRIGIATADTEVGIAGAFENYSRRTPALDGQYFSSLAKEERIGRFVVGLPVHLHGGESQKSTEARAFGDWLGKITGVPVDYFDERFTTAEADEVLGAAKLTKKQKQARRDQLAAQIMLTAYLEAGSRGQDSPGGIE
jgi:putative holliday junction resolvase